MRIYTSLTDAQIEEILRSTPSTNEQLTTVYSDEGIYEIRNKIHKVLIHDVPAETITINGRQFQTDPSVRTLQERWQIPLPHDSEQVTVYTYKHPNVTLIFEQGIRTTYYFEAATCQAVADFLLKKN